jgi:glyoxylase-like metal-dependent hydrolase (beta-lactamase superfamily II)
MYTIRPIRCGTITSTTKGGFTYLLDETQPMPIPVISFLITPDDPDDDRVVLVDTGIEDPPDGQFAGTTLRDGGPGPLREGLAAAGLEPADVDQVILTHLHHDHTGNIELFSEAEFFVQRSELDAARDPLPYLRRVYSEEHLEAIERSDPTVVDGDMRVCEGIELLHTPGHTEGTQSVLVETSAGPYVIVSDLVYCQQNLEPDLTELTDGEGRTIEVTPAEYDADYIPPGLHVSAADCYRSIERVRERVPNDGHILGGHPVEILGRRYPGNSAQQ